MKLTKILLTLVCLTSFLSFSNPSLFAEKTPGEKVDEAIDHANDKIDDAKDSAKDAVDDAKDSIDDKLKH